MTSFKIRVPASSANIGPGFDSMGMALNLYLTLDVSPADEWTIEQHSPHLPELASVDDHYIVQVARDVATRWGKALPACHITVRSDIPLARGLGSSAAAIVSGIELANQVCGLSLTREQKLELGTAIEGHPDNIAPALMGGFIIAIGTDRTIDWVQLPSPEVDVVVSIPGDALETKTARNVLPGAYPMERAASASAVSNVLVASLASGDYELAGRMMERDLFHEPYRKDLIPHYDDIRTEAKKHGAYGSVISGAGPTMMSLTPKGTGGVVVSHVEALLPDYQVTLLQMDKSGVVTDENANG
ncbi:homoserine kinase [Lentibacillus salinarum]|uniref:Homoserine kinase n=1 Tax=Lentibacillus salinarum TaxID=446820 RepID=A0ABW3ZZJ1_9BACI